MRILQKNPTFTFLALLSVIYAASILIVQSAQFRESPDLLAMAIVIDLTVTVTALFYFTMVRAKGLPIVSLAPVFLLSIAVTSWLIPAEHQAFLQYIKYLVVPAELTVAVYPDLQSARNPAANGQIQQL